MSAVKAYHLKWQELPLDANIKKWSVHVLNLDRHKRHLDRATLNQFWEILDRLLTRYLSDFEHQTLVLNPHLIPLCAHLTAIFPGDPVLATFIAAKDDGSGGD